ncbi:MAG TPA: hypothetical protein VMT93_02550, partial [Gemmatimonadaceae bacterium]|nr:hypothetical protein [Gemmatimonadaceae bacterium]
MVHARLSLAMLFLPCALAAQERVAVLGAPPAGDAAAAAAGTATKSAAVATRAATAPVIDGKEDDPIWAQAQLIDSFRQFRPKEDGEPTFRT